jgi:hypothetical protein
MMRRMVLLDELTAMVAVMGGVDARFLYVSGHVRELLDGDDRQDARVPS